MFEEILRPYKCSLSRVSPSNTTSSLLKLKCLDANIDIKFNWSVKDDLAGFLKKNIDKFMSVLLNNGKFDTDRIYDSNSFLEFIELHYVNLSPDAKLDEALLYIDALTTYDGQGVEINGVERLRALQLYFKSSRELLFYIESGVSEGYLQKIKFSNSNDLEYKIRHKYNLTVKGLSRLIKLSESKSSTSCFVAMAFTTDMFEVCEIAIKPALNDCGFKAYVVNDQHVDSDKTINDAILAGIKKARFTIADFTHHRGGVYFEAGYALGRGQKVIYTCREDEMVKAHFDIRNYQHIVWKDAEDFKLKLINKIEAFIID